MPRTVLTEHERVLGEVILEAFRRVVTRKLHLPEDRLAEAETVFGTVDVVPKPSQPSSVGVRDRDDRWVLATAVDGRADVLVTGAAERG